MQFLEKFNHRPCKNLKIANITPDFIYRCTACRNN